MERDNWERRMREDGNPYNRTWRFKLQYNNPLNFCAFPFSWCLNTEWYQINVLFFTLEIEKY